MSGPVCERCACPSLLPVPDRSGFARCPFCGWEGDIRKLPRKILMPESYREWSEKLERVRTGRLFVTIVEFDPESMAIMHIMEMLDIHSLCSSGGLTMLEFETRPDDTTLEKLRQLPGVRAVRLVSQNP